MRKIFFSRLSKYSNKNSGSWCEPIGNDKFDTVTINDTVQLQSRDSHTASDNSSECDGVCVVATLFVALTDGCF